MPEYPKKTNGMAIAGFVLRLIGCTGLLGLIFSAIALDQFKKDSNQEGKALATAGLVIGIIDVAGVLFWVFAFGAFVHSGTYTG